jgi:predicted Rdx family selenoprotein
MDLRREAVGLQKAAEQKFGIKPKIKTGGMGDLIVRVDDVTVFDHKKDGGFPGNEELLRRISAAQQRSAPAV